MSIKDALLADYDHEMGTTRKLLERLPDDKLSWKPHEKSMSLGGLATHLSNIPNWGGTILNEPFFDLAAAPPNRPVLTSRADILAVFEETRDRVRAWMDKSDAEFNAPWTLKRGGHVPQLRAASHHPPPRPVERLPPAQRRPGARDLRSISRRGFIGNTLLRGSFVHFVTSWSRQPQCNHENTKTRTVHEEDIFFFVVLRDQMKRPSLSRTS
jgi:hypothetical protein